VNGRKAAEENAVDDADRLRLSEDEGAKFTPRDGNQDDQPWKVLIVDDEEEVHVVTHLALSDFSFAGRPLTFVSAYSGSEAKELIAEHQDTAIILLDVVMETDEAGLDVAQYVRQTLGNYFVRIILRTGQPGMAPERRVLKAYDINDYRAKTELTRDRLFSVVYTALSSYRDLVALARNRNQLMSLVNELEQFAHIATNELKVPVISAVDHVQVLRELYQKSGKSRESELLEKVWADIKKIDGVVDDLITLTNAGSYNESRELTNCELVVAEAAANLDDMIQRRQVTLTTEALPTVYACRRQLVQLFENLISNAIKFQPGEAPQVHISATSKGRSWLFSVADKGIGISPEHHASIFTIYHRAHKEGNVDGSGIGLAICEKIVRWHGGRIWVESTPGQGATFYFTLPLKD
jgi:two-component system, sensor histidine kinase